jgi:hypothetical protein
MIEVNTVGELIEALKSNCSMDDQLRLKLWNTSMLRNVCIRTEGRDGYPLEGFIILTTTDMD